MLLASRSWKIREPYMNITRSNCVNQLMNEVSFIQPLSLCKHYSCLTTEPLHLYTIDQNNNTSIKTILSHLIGLELHDITVHFITCIICILISSQSYLIECPTLLCHEEVKNINFPRPYFRFYFWRRLQRDTRTGSKVRFYCIGTKKKEDWVKSTASQDYDWHLHWQLYGSNWTFINLQSFRWDFEPTMLYAQYVDDPDYSKEVLSVFFHSYFLLGGGDLLG